MPDRHSSPPPKVTVEDLLRLKRAERPAPAFWNEFERELRQKQLAALVEKKSWWHGFAAVQQRFGRLGLPIGATAILAVTFLSMVRYAPSTGESRRIAPANMPVQPPVASVVTPRVADPVPPVAAVDRAVLRDSIQTAAADGATPVRVVVDAPRETPKESSTAISWLANLPAENANVAGLASRLTATAVEPEFMAPSLGFEDRAMPAVRVRHAAEILPTAAAVTGPRRARLLAALGSAATYQAGPVAPEHARRNAIRRMAEDALDHSSARREAEGNGLSIRF
jgi:hypothetical protein